jgi:hypothetical protein
VRIHFNVAADPLLNTNRIRVSTLAPRARLPTMHGIREYVEAGGLMSYGPNVVDQHRRAAESTNVAARTLGLHTHVIHASTERNFDAAFGRLAPSPRGRAAPDPFFLSQRDQLATLAVQHGVPASYNTGSLKF